MVSRNSLLPARFLANVFGILLALGVTTHSEELPSTILQGELRAAFEDVGKLKTVAPALAEVLSGKTGDLNQERQELLSLPVDQPNLVALGNAALGMAQEKQAPSSGAPWIRESSLRAGSDLGIHWFLLLTQLQYGTPAGFNLQLDGMESAMLTQGWQRLPEAASWLLASAQELEGKGQRETAELARKAALRLDPVSPVPPWTIATKHIARFQLPEAYSQLSEASKRIMAYPSSQEVFAFNALRLLRYGMALTFLLVLVAWLFRYWPWITHQWAERMPRHTPLVLRYIVIATALIALMVAGLGLTALCLLIAFLLWLPAKKYERFLIGTLVLYIGAQPFLAKVEGSLSSRFDMIGAEALYQRAVEEGWSQPLQEQLEESQNTATGEDKALLTVGKSILYRKKGVYSEALSAGESAWRLNSSDPRALVNMGNLRFLVTQYDSAEGFYRQAQPLDPNNGPLVFNLGQSASYRGRTDSTAVVFRQAASIPRYRVDISAQQNGRNFQVLPANRIVMDPELSAKATWTSILDEIKNGKTTLSRWDLRTGVLDIPPLLLPWVSIGLLFFLFWWGQKPRPRRVIFQCKTCGRVMCQHCRKGIHCNSCFRRLSGIDEVELRNSLLERIYTERSNKEKLLWLGLDMALPGTGSLMSKPNVLSFVKVVLLAFSLTYILNLPNFLSLYPVEETMAGRPFALFVLACLYGASAIQLIRKSGRNTLMIGEA